MNIDEHRLTKLMVAAIAVLLLVTEHALAQPCGGYEVTAIIQTPVNCGFGFDITTGLGLNDEGAVVGLYWCSGWEHKEAFVWTAEEGFVTLERPEGVSSAKAVDINDHSDRQIVGTVDISGLGTRAFLIDGQEWIIIPPPGGGTFSSVAALNNKRQVIGSTADGTPYSKAYIWEDGVMTIIEPTFGPRSAGRAIDEAGVVVGWMGTSIGIDSHAFLWDDKRVIDLGVIPGGFTGSANVVNSRAQIAIGGNFNEDHPLGFISGGFFWDAGQWTDVGMLPGYDSMALTGLNDAGQIVGWSRDIQAGQHPDTGFIWQDGVMTKINDLLPSDSELTVYRAEAINNVGQITGRATNQDNDPVAFILTPIEGPLADLNRDCEVGVADLLILLASWGPCNDCGNCPADFNADGDVGVIDLLVLLGNWG